MMGSKTIKAALIGAWVVFGLVYLTSSSMSKAVDPDDTKPAPPATNKADGYVGSEACKTCHAVQFENFSRTLHGRISQQSNWKGRMQGCESCHGPGGPHVEGGGDKTKIRTFQGESYKQISQNCLECHAGKEEH